MKFETLMPSLLVASTVAIASVLPASAATLVAGSTDTYQFENIFAADGTTGFAAGDAFVGAFRFRVIESAVGQVSFRFSVTADSPLGAYVSNIYFNYSGTGSASDLLSSPVTNVSNVGFANYASTSSGVDLIQGALTSFESSNTFAEFAPVNATAATSQLGRGETLGLRFTGDLATVLAALQSNTLRIGINVAGLSGGGSDSFVSGQAPVSDDDGGSDDGGDDGGSDDGGSDDGGDDGGSDDGGSDDGGDDGGSDDGGSDDGGSDDGGSDDGGSDDGGSDDGGSDDGGSDDGGSDDGGSDDGGSDDGGSDDGGSDDGGDDGGSDDGGSDDGGSDDGGDDGGTDVPDVPTEEVPEPLTILGSGLALGLGAWFRRSQKRQDND